MLLLLLATSALSSNRSRSWYNSIKNLFVVIGRIWVNNFMIDDSYNKDTDALVNNNKFLLVLVVSYLMRIQCDDHKIVLIEMNKPYRIVIMFMFKFCC